MFKEVIEDKRVMRIINMFINNTNIFSLNLFQLHVLRQTYRKYHNTNYSIIFLYVNYKVIILILE